MSSNILLITPPMLQLNTPYPATTYLAGSLEASGLSCGQDDLSLKLALDLLSLDGINRIYARISETNSAPHVAFFREHVARYRECIDPVISFLQGRDATLALRICSRSFLPEGPRFSVVDAQLEEAFGNMGLRDAARYLASLFIDDLQDVIQTAIDPFFSVARYGEQIAASQPTMEPLLQALESREDTLVSERIRFLTSQSLTAHTPNLLALTVPFPGNVYGAFLIAREAKRLRPDLKIVLGGGYVNTELRTLKEPRVFNYVDFVCLDSGIEPMKRIVDVVQKGAPREKLKRTFVREGGEVVFVSDGSFEGNSPMQRIFPTTKGLPLKSYLSVVEMLNPMHRLWSDGRWNKLILAEGCYWKKCSFCDVNLPYIRDYQPFEVDHIIAQMERLISETGETGFHFVDEAAPPKLLAALSKSLIKRGLVTTWWTNVRFEKSFDRELVELMARAGCVAVSGGLEVASDRLLKKMKKGVSVSQVARVTHHFSKAGILVHAYLMYGFPTQTAQETVESLETVRQLFRNDCIHSAFWHRFVATVHSPVGQNPEEYGIKILPQDQKTFASNDLPFVDPTGVDHDTLGEGLRRATYNFMLGRGFEVPVRDWFPVRVPKSRVPTNLVGSALKFSIS